MGKSTISMAIFNSKLFYFLLLDMKFRLDGGGWGSRQDQRRETHAAVGRPANYLGMVDSTPLMVIFWMVYDWCCHVLPHYVVLSILPGIIIVSHTWLIIGLNRLQASINIVWISALFWDWCSFFSPREDESIEKGQSDSSCGFHCDIATWDTQTLCKLSVRSPRHPMFFLSMKQLELGNIGKCVITCCHALTCLTSSDFKPSPSKEWCNGTWGVPWLSGNDRISPHVPWHVHCFVIVCPISSPCFHGFLLRHVLEFDRGTAMIQVCLGSSTALCKQLCPTKAVVSVVSVVYGETSVRIWAVRSTPVGWWLFGGLY